MFSPGAPLFRHPTRVPTTQPRLFRQKTQRFQPCSDCSDCSDTESAGLGVPTENGGPGFVAREKKRKLTSL